MDRNDQLIEEYKALREEILKKQEARLIMLGFTITATGTIMGLTLGDSSSVTAGLDYYTLALTIFALVILIAALMLTIQYGQQIGVISSYIREFIEPETNGGIRWESKWLQYRKALRSNPKASGLPLGTSKPLALYYGFLTVAVYSTSFVTGLHHYLFALVLVSVLALFALVFSFDLHQKKTKGWKVDWEVIENQQKQQSDREDR